ncbi:hypothetical protein Vretimale_18916 [Volvox reticuliferus]|nr:hypothetical protein Vretimale_18916 [Volvox reticuliferus]
MSNGKVGVPSARSLPEHYLSVRAALTLTAVAKHVSHKVIAQHFTSAAAAFVDAGAPSNQLKADWRDSAFLAECSGNLMSYASRKTVEMHFEVLQRVAAELQPLRRQGIAANAAITPAAVVIADATKCEGPCGGDGNVGGDAAVGYAAAANAAAEAEAQLKLPTTFRCRYAVHAAALAEEQAAAVQQRERQLGQQRKQEQRQQQRRKDRAPVAPVARRGLTDAAMALDESRMDPQLMGAMACREALCQLSDKFNSGWSSSPPWEQPQPSGSFPQQPLTPGSKCSQFDGDRNNRGAANAGLCTIDAAAFAHKEADSEVTPTLAAAPMAVGPHMEMACAAEGISENLQFVHEGPTSGSSHVDAEAVVRTGAISDRHAGAGKDVQQEAAAKKAPGTTMERTDTVAQPSTPQPVGRPTQLAVRWAVLEGGPGSAVPQPPPEELDADVDHEKDPRVVRTKLVYLLLAACFTQLTGRWSTSRSSLLQLAVAAAAAAIELLSYHHTFLAVNGISAEAARRLFGKGRLSSRAQYQWVLLRPEEGMPPPLEDGRKEVKARPSLPRAGDLGPPLALSFVPCSRRVDRRWRSLRRRAARLRSNDRVFSYTIRSTWIDADTPAGATWSSPTSCTSEPAISSSRHAADSTQQWLESHLGSGALTRFICEGRDALAAVTLGIARAQAAARRRGCCFLVAPSLFEETLNSTLVRESAKSFLRGYIDIVRMPGTGAVPGSSAQGAPSCSGENEESEDTRSSSSDDDDHDTSGDETVIGVRGNGNAIARGKRRNRFGGGGTLLTSEMSLRVCEGWRNLRLVSFNRAVSTLMALEPNQAALLLGGEALREATVGSIGATATTGDCRTTDSGRYNISASAGDDGADGRNVTKCKAEGRWDGDEDGAGRRHRILFDEIEDMCLRQGVLRLTPSTGIHLEVLEVPFADLDEVETEGRATPGVSRTSCG